jgi:hypothetical protein
LELSLQGDSFDNYAEVYLWADALGRAMFVDDLEHGLQRLEIA